MSREKIIISTGNKDKVKEIREILGTDSYEILDKNEAGYEAIEFEETGETLEENAILKARGLWNFTKSKVIADDTGLFVESLDDSPGIFSARYSGENATDKKNRAKLLKEMRNKKNRKAKFITVIALIDEEGNEKIFKGECSGKILEEEKGNFGFGYDSIFVPDGYVKTFGELTNEEKAKISHRSKALEELKKYFNK